MHEKIGFSRDGAGAVFLLNFDEEVSLRVKRFWLECWISLTRPHASFDCYCKTYPVNIFRQLVYRLIPASIYIFNRDEPWNAKWEASRER